MNPIRNRIHLSLPPIFHTTIDSSPKSSLYSKQFRVGFNSPECHCMYNNVTLIPFYETIVLKRLVYIAFSHLCKKKAVYTIRIFIWFYFRGWEE